MNANYVDFEDLKDEEEDEDDEDDELDGYVEGLAGKKRAPAVK
jgi:hypothetical protein